MKVDLENLMYHYKMDRKTMENMLQLYLISSKEDFGVLEKQMEDRNLALTKKSIHKMKSSYAYLLIDEIVSLCDCIKAEADIKPNYSAIEHLLIQFSAAHLLITDQVYQLLKK